MAHPEDGLRLRGRARMGRAEKFSSRVCVRLGQLKIHSPSSPTPFPSSQVEGQGAPEQGTESQVSQGSICGSQSSGQAVSGHSARCRLPHPQLRASVRL